MTLNENNYFSPAASRKYMSVSQFKAFEKCAAAAMAEIKGKYQPERTVPMLVGSYVDAYFDGELDKFCAENPDLFRKDGSLKAEFVGANDVIRRIERDKMMMRFFGGEKQVIMTGEINGVPVKCKIDSLLKNKIVDRKIMRDFADVYVADKGGRVPWFEAWDYILQGAVYQEIVRQNTGKRLPFYLAAATKERVPDIAIIQIAQEQLDEELERFKRDAVFYNSVKQGLIKPDRCGHCDYCRETKVIRKPSLSTDLFL